MAVDDPALIHSDTRKATLWSALSGIASVASLAFGPGFYPSWYALLVAIGHGLLLPALAVLHIRHAAVRQSGAVLGTAAGLATVAVGIAASASGDLVVASLFVLGIWWWTIGKIWAATGVLPRRFGTVTMALAAVAFAAAVLSAPLGADAPTLWLAERAVVGVWTIALAVMLWRSR